DLTALADRATIELNRPFAPGAAFPVRLFVLRRPGHHYVGRTYRHWIGDDHFMNSLLCRVLAGYLGVPPASSLDGSNRRCPALGREFVSALGPFRWCTRAGDMVGE